MDSTDTTSKKLQASTFSVPYVPAQGGGGGVVFENLDTMPALVDPPLLKGLLGGFQGVVGCRPDGGGVTVNVASLIMHRPVCSKSPRERRSSKSKVGAPLQRNMPYTTPYTSNNPQQGVFADGWGS